MNKSLTAAIEYAAKGWHVFPLHSIDKNGGCTCGESSCTDQGKHPRTKKGLKEASRDLAKIEEWFGNASLQSNVGIATGSVSDLTVIDIDTADGKMGAESWKELIKDHGEPVTLMSETGSGGMHVLFQYNSALNTAVNILGDGIDSRNDGGYIVAPPSLHKSGGTYKWINGGQALATLPAHLSRKKERRGRPKEGDVYKGKHTLEQVDSMLQYVPADDRDMWRKVGIILGKDYERSDEAWEVYVSWSSKFNGKKGNNHDAVMKEAFFDISQKKTDNPVTVSTIIKEAVENGWAPAGGSVPIENFIFYAPENNFIYRPTVTHWIGSAVDSAVAPVNEGGKIVKASKWITRNKLATSMTCDPDIDGDFLKGHDCMGGEVVAVGGAALFNRYRKATIELGDPKLASPFLQHVKRVFDKPGDADQFLDYMAHRVQKPGEKPRFALLIAGMQGAGKDTAVEFCSPAIGYKNIANVEPAAMEKGFNEFCAATLVRISETANLKDMSKWAFNEQVKVLIAGSPDYVEINPKYGKKFSLRMFCGVIITTNHLSSGIYIPSDDRRYDVIEAATVDDMGIGDSEDRKAYFEDLWYWFYAGGASHIAAYLHDRDVSNFSASNGQRKTEAHKMVVASGMTSDNWLDDIIDELGTPDQIRSDWIIERAVSKGENQKDVQRKLLNTISRLGYKIAKNPDSKDGRYKIEGKRVTFYVKNGVSFCFHTARQEVGIPF